MGLRGWRNVGGERERVWIWVWVWVWSRSYGVGFWLGWAGTDMIWDGNYGFGE
jgi:hypothetical protein